MTTLVILNLGNNQLGMTGNCAEPPVCILAEMLVNSNFLEDLDLSYNGINQPSVFCLSHGLTLSKSINKLSLEGNPLGSMGIKLLMKAKNDNTDQDFHLNLRLADSEFDLAQEKADLKLFTVANPEGPYSLNMDKQYD